MGKTIGISDLVLKGFPYFLLNLGNLGWGLWLESRLVNFLFHDNHFKEMVLILFFFMKREIDKITIFSFVRAVCFIHFFVSIYYEHIWIKENIFKIHKAVCNAMQPKKYNKYKAITKEQNHASLF